MSVEYYYSDNYYGGYGELANPLQWPQLRKKRRLVALTPPNLLPVLLLLYFGRPLSHFMIGLSPPPIHPKIRSARNHP